MRKQPNRPSLSHGRGPRGPRSPHIHETPGLREASRQSFRPLRGARSPACHTGSLVPVVGFGGLPSPQWCKPLVWDMICMWARCFCGQASSVGQAPFVGQAAGFRAGLGTLYPPPSSAPNRVCRGGPACPPHCSTWSKPPGLPCRRPRRQSYTPHLSGASNCHLPPRLAAWPARLRAPPQHAAAKWSKPLGLPHRQSCRRSAAQTLPSSVVRCAHGQLAEKSPPRPSSTGAG